MFKIYASSFSQGEELFLLIYYRYNTNIIKIIKYFYTWVKRGNFPQHTPAFHHIHSRIPAFHPNTLDGVGVERSFERNENYIYMHITRNSFRGYCPSSAVCNCAKSKGKGGKTVFVFLVG